MRSSDFLWRLQWHLLDFQATVQESLKTHGLLMYSFLKSPWWSSCTFIVWQGEALSGVRWVTPFKWFQACRARGFVCGVGSQAKGIPSWLTMKRAWLPNALPINREVGTAAKSLQASWCPELDNTFLDSAIRYCNEGYTSPLWLTDTAIRRTVSKSDSNHSRQQGKRLSACHNM